MHGFSLFYLWAQSHSYPLIPVEYVRFAEARTV